MKNNIQKAYFAGGCFWGLEYYFQNLKGVLSTRAGYMGGLTDKPTYNEICAKKTGHAETVEVFFDQAVVSYEELAKLFFEIHDPTQIDRQGPDIGNQYRSVIFYTDEEQKKVAQNLIGRLVLKGYKVATELAPATTFWAAETYHQKYYAKSGSQPYCHIRKKIF